MINCRILIYYHKKKNCSKANIIHLFRLSLKNSTQNKNKINIKHRLLFSFLRSVLTSQDEVFCFRSDSLFSSAYILNIFWGPCLCCITQRVGITIFYYFYILSLVTIECWFFLLAILFDFFIFSPFLSRFK